MLGPGVGNGAFAVPKRPASISASASAGVGLWLLLTATAAQAQTAPVAPQVIDVVGVRLGMSPAEATVATGRAGMPNSEKAGQGFVGEKVRVNGQGDLVFYSAFKSTLRGAPGAVVTTGYPANTRSLAVVFLPDPGNERAWGISHLRTYGAGTGPSTANTIEGLVRKYGEPVMHSGLATANFIKGVPSSQQTRGGVMYWHWTRDGRRMNRPSTEACRQALHDSYIGMGDGNVGIYNAAVIDKQVTLPAWRRGLQAGCGRIIQASINWDADGTVDQLSVSAIDLPMAYAEAMKLQGIVTGRDQEALRQRKKQAEGRSPDL